MQFQHLLLALREGYVDEQLELAVYTDHQLFERYYRAQETRKFSKKKALTLRELKTLQPGDYVTHQDYGIARFAGLTQVEINGQIQEAIRLVYRDDDLLTVSIHSLHKIAKYSGAEGSPPTMSKLGSPEWENKKKSVKKEGEGHRGRPDSAVRQAQNRAGLRLFARRVYAGRARIELYLRGHARPGQGHRGREAGHAAAPPDGPPRVRRCGLRQDRSGHSGGL